MGWIASEASAKVFTLLDIDTRANRIDPVLHEAVQHEGDGAEGAKPVIGTVMRQGYRLGDQVLRHALVAVVDTVESAETGQDTDDNGSGSGD